MQENVQVFKIKHGGKKEYEFIDLSGHPSKQYRLKKYCTNIKYVIFMIDSTDLQNINNSSKMLYHLLSLKLFNSITPKPKILIIGNKNEQKNKQTVVTIKSNLLKELNKLYNSESSLSSVQDSGNDENETVNILRKDYKPTTKGAYFNWKDIDYDISFDSCSVLEKKIQPILDILS